MGKAGGSSVFKDIDHIHTVFAVALFLFCYFKFKNPANGHHFPRGGCVTLGPDTTWGPLCGFSLVLAPLLPGGHRDLSVLLGKVRLRGGWRRAEGAEQPMHVWGWSCSWNMEQNRPVSHDVAPGGVPNLTRQSLQCHGWL